MASQLPDLSFRRIRVATQEDIDRLYPVLAAYIQTPTLASTVTELVINVASWPTSRWHLLRPKVQVSTPAAGPEEVALHSRIEAYVRALGLSKDATTSILQSLSWKFNSHPLPSDGNSAYGPNSTHCFASAASTLLLSLCPNITLLHAYNLESSAPIRDFLLRNNYGRLPLAHLQRLEEVQIQSWSPYDERVYDQLDFLEYFRFFGRLPGMRTYAAEAVVDFQANRLVAPPGSSEGITKIRITNADVSANTVGAIIRVPRGLEEFTLSIGGLSHSHGGAPLVSPKTLGKCLLEQKGTLRVLDVDVACFLGWQRDEEEEEEEEDNNDYDKDEYFRLDEESGNGGPLRSFDLPNTRKYGLTIGSLHDFEALEHLAISVRLMLGPVAGANDGYGRTRTVIPPFRLVDALPRNLKSLHLYDYVVGQCPLADEHVKELRLKMAERFPFLTEVEGLDEPLIKNSKYVEETGFDEEDPSGLVGLRESNRGLDWESV